MAGLVTRGCSGGGGGGDVPLSPADDAVTVTRVRVTRLPVVFELASSARPVPADRAVTASGVVELDVGAAGFPPDDRTVILATMVPSCAVLTRVTFASSAVDGGGDVSSHSSVDGAVMMTRGDVRRVSAAAGGWPVGAVIARVRTVGVGPVAPPAADLVADVVEDDDTLAVTLLVPARALLALAELALRSAGDPPITQPFTVVCADPELRAAGIRREAAGVAARPRVPSGCVAATVRFCWMDERRGGGRGGVGDFGDNAEDGDVAGDEADLADAEGETADPAIGGLGGGVGRSR